MTHYFNHHFQIAATRWERWSFLHKWYRLNARDRRWVPPYMPALSRMLNQEQTPHLARMNVTLLHVEALPRQDRRNSTSIQEPLPANVSFEVPVLTTAVFIDPRRKDHTAYFGLFTCVNSSETVDRWLTVMQELLRQHNCTRLVGPVGLSPYLGSGVLQDCWQQTPPQHTAYNPPYLPEVMGFHFRTLAKQHLYTIPVSNTNLNLQINERVQLRPLHPHHLTTNLLPLLTASLTNRLGFAPPDTAEAEFLLSMIDAPTPFGWTAHLGDKIVGFILLQADQGPTLRRLGGGRHLWQRLIWQGVKKRGVKNGRLLFGGVDPAFRRQGVGTRLLQQALQAAHVAGWQSLAAGPFGGGETAVSFLQKFNAHPQQTYSLYETHL